MTATVRAQLTARLREMQGFAFLACAAFLLISLLSFHPDDLPFFSSAAAFHVRNLCGVTGAYLAAGVRALLGVAGYLIPGLLFCRAAACFMDRPATRRYAQIIGFLGCCVATATLLSILWVPDPVARVWRGGLIGLGVGDWLLRYMGFGGAVIVTLAIGSLSFLLATELLLVPLLAVAWRAVWQPIRRSAVGVGRRLRRMDAPQGFPSVIPRGFPSVTATRPVGRRADGSSETPRDDRKDVVVVAVPPTGVAEPARLRLKEAAQETPPGARPMTPQMPRGAAQGSHARPAHRGTSVVVGQYQLPPLDRLAVPAPVEGRPRQEDAQAAARTLQETLRDFGIEVKVTHVEQGPVITRYELEPAPGVKVTKITGLSDDMALALKAPSVRIIAPIPGKARVGIEVPNGQATLVSLREVLESEAFRQSPSRLTVALGKDTAGQPLVADLAGMPHLLIAGTTGSGKTVCVNSVIMSLLMTATPEEVKFLMVDPKMVELAVFNGLPHLIAPVQTDPKRVSKALGWVVQEMETRYKLFARLGLRNIEAYHQKRADGQLPEDDLPDSLPYLLVIIDELADLMMVARTEVETAIGRLAQLSRAVGIHMILATQRPSVDVLTGVIKANFPARISFQVASKVDARTVLDQVGAEKLLGHGDLLFMKPGAAKLIRAQGCLVTDQEIEQVVAFITPQRPPASDEAIFDDARGAARGGPMVKDPMYDEAVQVIINAGQASVSLLQRRLRLGYGRAARMLDVLEQEGVVGPIRGVKPREVLVETARGAAGAAPGEQEGDDANDR